MLPYTEFHRYQWNHHQCCHRPNFTKLSVYCFSILKYDCTPVNWFRSNDMGILADFVRHYFTRDGRQIVKHSIYFLRRMGKLKHVSVKWWICFLIRLLMRFSRNVTTCGSIVPFNYVAQSNDCSLHVAKHLQNLISISPMFHAWYFTSGTSPFQRK
jgi:hypothetical protein